MRVIIQHDKMDCGPACLAMVAFHHGKDISIQHLRKKCEISREGVSILGISNAAEDIGFSTYPLELSLPELDDYKNYLPCILHWTNNHFVILYKITKHPISGKKTYKVIDPSHGKISFSEDKMKEYWTSHQNQKGIALLCVPNDNFQEVEYTKRTNISWGFFKKYLKNYKKRLGVLFILLLIGNVLNIALPFLTQNLIDKGVILKDINFVYLIIISQFIIFTSSIIIEVFRNWITLNLGTRFSISIISDFLNKLLKLPISFFETKMIGDLNQRINDNQRIEDFLTSQSLLTFFSLVSFTVFLGILCYYNFIVFGIFLALSVISVFWSVFWLNKRRSLDYVRFRERSLNQNAIIEIISSVNEMKLNNFQGFKLDEWESHQQKLFEINKRTLKVDQYLFSGFEFLNQLKTIIVSLLTAILVIKGQLSLGGMLAIAFIIGQLNAPFSQFLSFMRSFQFAKLSAERLEEVQEEEGEESLDQIKLSEDSKSEIKFNNVSFSYSNKKLVLKDINFIIPEGKVTAIVGSSGSGKTTLIKLLLKFYKIEKGEIFISNYNINDISASSLRGKIGTVMQDGFIFSETLLRNIVMGDIEPDMDKLQRAISIANLEEFVSRSALGLETPLGSFGNEISGGEKQRILIARAIYKEPDYLFFDEATSALDAENERIIHNNLQRFFKGRTVIIVAHRLSTVKNADQIIVLNKGEISEIGTHSELTIQKGEYYNLVRNQLELGN